MHNTPHAKAARFQVSLPQFDPALMLIRVSEVEQITGLKRTTIYKRLKDDPTFPRPVPLTDSTARGAPVGWVLGEVQDWVRSRLAIARGGCLNE